MANIYMKNADGSTYIVGEIQTSIGKVLISENDNARTYSSKKEYKNVSDRRLNNMLKEEKKWSRIERDEMDR